MLQGHKKSSHIREKDNMFLGKSKEKQFLNHQKNAKLRRWFFQKLRRNELSKPEFMLRNIAS